MARDARTDVLRAKLSDGVLRLELPKVEKARPRQITVRTETPLRSFGSTTSISAST